MPKKRPTEKRRYHFDLSHSPVDGVHHLNACLRRHELVPHDAASRRAAAASSALLGQIPASRLTHYVDVELPSDAVALMTVTRPEARGGQEVDVPVALALHVPQASTERLRGRLRRLPAKERPWAVHPALEHLSVSPQALRQAGGDPVFPDDHESYHDALQTAKSLLFLHAGLVALDVENDRAERVKEVHIAAAKGLVALARKIYRLHGDWSKMTPQVDKDGKPVVYQTGPRKGQRAYAMELDDEVVELMTAPLQDALRRVRDDAELEDSMWSVVPGRVSPFEQGREALSSSARLRSAEPKWAYRNDAPRYGLELSSPKFEEPPAEDHWSGKGLWTGRDPSRPLPDGIVESLAAGTIDLLVTTAQKPQGVLRSPVKLAVGQRGAKLSLKPVGGAKGSGEATLGLGSHGLTFDVTVKGVDGSPSLSFRRHGEGTSLYSQPLANRSGLGTLSLEVKNWVPRYLSSYVQFLHPTGKAFDPPDWQERLPEVARGLLQSDPTKKWVGLLGPDTALFSVPIKAASEQVELPLPKGATTVRLLLGGLGHGQDYDAAVCGVGMGMTIVVNMVIPVVLLIAGAGIGEVKQVQEFFEETDNVVALAAILGPLYVAESATEAILVDQDPIPVLARTANLLLPTLVEKGLLKLLSSILAEEAVTSAVPVVKIIFTLISAATTISSLVQTVVGIFASPFVFDIDLKRTMGIRATLLPDPKTRTFPDLATRLRTYLIYDDDANGRVHEQSVDWDTTAKSEPQVVELKDVPVGGKLKLVAVFYSENGWQAGQGESDWYAAEPNSSSNVLEIARVPTRTNEVPLTVDTRYHHRQRLAFDPNSGYQWRESEAPSEVDLSRSDGKKKLRSLDQIAHNGPAARLGYVWQATGLGLPLDGPGAKPSDDFERTVRTVSIFREHPDAQSLKVGWSRETGLAFELPGAPDGRHFLVEGSAGEFDPDRNRRGGFHLRRLDLGKALALPAANRSWGRFTFPPASMSVHPGGAVIGVSRQPSKLGVLRLPDAPVDDAKAPCALLLSGAGTADGLLGEPVAVATALDGRILVLEAGNLRVQAFDLMANPVYAFARKRCWFPLKGAGPKTRALDMAVEPKGHVYVLSYEDRGEALQASDFHLDVYRPDGTFLARTDAVNAGRISVSLVRNLYTLNFEMIEGEGGRPEPSVSLWLPSPPKPA